MSEEISMESVAVADTAKELRCSVAIQLLKYVSDLCGEEAMREMVRATRMNLSYIRRSSNWVSFDYYCRLLRKVVEVTGVETAPFDACMRYSDRETVRTIGVFFAHLGSPKSFFDLVGRFNRLWNTGLSEFTVEKLEDCRCVLRVTPIKYKQDRLNCLAIKGCLASVPRFFGLPPAAIQDLACACDGDEACVYSITWQPQPQLNSVRVMGGVGIVVGLSMVWMMGVSVASVLLAITAFAMAVLLGEVFGLRKALTNSLVQNVTQADSLVESMRETEQLNATLQKTVETRTEALRVAYTNLEKSKSRELVQQRVATIGTLSEGMAHELNTPLNTIQLALQGLQNNQVGARERSELQRSAWSAALRCSRIVNELLAFSREPQTVSLMRLHEAVEGSLSIFEDEMPEGLTLLREFSDPPPLAHVDGAQIQQALLNLLNNAADAVAQNGAVTVRMRPVDGEAVVEVADSGPGIPVDRLEHVFEPFESTKRKTGAGLGLGLSISAELAEKNGGTIDVVNQPDSGACFSIRFPLITPGSENLVLGRGVGRLPLAVVGVADVEEGGVPGVLQATSQGGAEFSAGALHVLLVEDDAGAGLTLKRTMEREDVRVTHVLTGRQGIEAFDTDRFDAVVTDVLLGDMTGVDVLRSIREQDNAFPVILLTGHDSIGSAIDALRLGAQDYIQKPLERIDDLIAPIQKAVNHHRLRVESEKLTEELRTSEARFRSFAELLPETVFEADTSGKVIFLNQSGREKFGITQEHLDAGYFVFHGVVEDEHDRVHAALAQVLAGETVSGLELAGVHTSGDTFPILVFATPIRSNGDVVGLRSIVVDITRQKAAEKDVLHYQEMLREMDSQLQITEERERCALATDLHDSVAQLLAATKMRMSLAGRVSSNPDVGEHLREASQILTDAMDQTRSLVFQLSPPSLYSRGLQAAIHDLAGHMLKLHGLQVAVTGSETPLVLDERASIHIFRAVRELLVNVAKHSGTSRCLVTIEVTEGETRVTVEDKGDGFLITPVSRGNTRDGFGLFGIGERLKTIGGRLVLESEPGKGTKATVAVPS